MAHVGICGVPFCYILRILYHGCSSLGMRYPVEYRLLSWLEIHHSVPLSLVVIPLVVDLGQSGNAVKSRITLRPVSCTSILGSFLTVASQLPIQQLIVHLGSSLHGVCEKLAKLILALFWQIALGNCLIEHLLYLLSLISQLFIVCQSGLDICLTPRQVRDHLILRISFFRSRIRHEFRLADVCQAIAFLHHRQHLFSQFLAELAGPEVLLMLSQPLIVWLQFFLCIVAWIDIVHIPSHIQEEFYLIFSRLDIAHIQNPELLDALVPCHRHLLIQERW